MRREQGQLAVTFPENPYPLGLPSVHASTPSGARCRAVEEIDIVCACTWVVVEDAEHVT